VSGYIRSTNNSKVIVFVHGFLGDDKSTWSYSSDVYWPALLLSDSAFIDYDIYVANYRTEVLGNKTVEDIVSSLKNRLDGADVFTKYHQVVFVCHSLGGVVVQRLLIAHPEYATQVPFIYFFAVPQIGSDFARYVNVFSSNPIVDALRGSEGNNYLQALETDWKRISLKIRKYCAYEEQKTNGVIVVDRWSETRNCDESVAIDENHKSIVKPSGPNHESYVALLNAVRARAKELAPATKPSPPPFSVRIETLVNRTYQDWWTVNGNVQVCQVNLLGFVRIVNLQPVPAMLDRFDVEVRTQDGRWVKLYRMPTQGLTVYGGRLGAAHPIQADFLDRLMIDHTLEANSGALRGWVLFDYPAGEDFKMFTNRLRATVSDFAGKRYVIDPLAPALSSVQVIQYKLLPETMNLAGIETSEHCGGMANAKALKARASSVSTKISEFVSQREQLSASVWYLKPEADKTGEARKKFDEESVVQYRDQFMFDAMELAREFDARGLGVSHKPYHYTCGFEAINLGEMDVCARQLSASADKLK